MNLLSAWATLFGEGGDRKIEVWGMRGEDRDKNSQKCP